jgi:hypothetical protein
MTQPASSVADVIARMQSDVASMPKTDGVACFMKLYLAVTVGVQARLAGLAFHDPRFLARLDVVFAELFLSALDTSRTDPARLPRAWAPLVEARSQHGIAPLQFALAGMNAHINRDLPVALVATCRELRLDLGEASPEHADFEHVNGLLAQVERRVKSSYLTGWLAWLDRLVHRLRRIDDVVAMWDVGRAGALGAGRRTTARGRLPARARPDGRPGESGIAHSGGHVAAQARAHASVGLGQLLNLLGGVLGDRISVADADDARLERGQAPQ